MSNTTINPHNAQNGQTINSVGGDRPVIQIRKSHPGERFRRTGKAVLHHFICRDETLDFSVTSPRLQPVRGPALYDFAVSDVVEPHLVYEVIPDEGERFGYPVPIGTRTPKSGSLEECEREAFKEHMYHSLEIYYPKRDEEFLFGVDGIEGEVPSVHPNFEREVEAALAPHMIERLDHPLVQHLQHRLGLSEIEIQPANASDSCSDLSETTEQ